MNNTSNRDLAVLLSAIGVVAASFALSVPITHFLRSSKRSKPLSPQKPTGKTGRKVKEIAEKAGSHTKKAYQSVRRLPWGQYAQRVQAFGEDTLEDSIDRLRLWNEHLDAQLQRAPVLSPYEQAIIQREWEERATDLDWRRSTLPATGSVLF